MRKVHLAAQRTAHSNSGRFAAGAKAAVQRQQRASNDDPGMDVAVEYSLHSAAFAGADMHQNHNQHSGHVWITALRGNRDWGLLGNKLVTYADSTEYCRSTACVNQDTCSLGNTSGQRPAICKFASPQVAWLAIGHTA
jgi:hypothetical protein